MKNGLTLLEVLISLVLLTIFIFGGMLLYASSVTQTKRSRILLTTLWLARGKLDETAESRQPLAKRAGKFEPPLQDYSYKITEEPLPQDSVLQLVTVEVKGSSGARISLQRIR